MADSREPEAVTAESSDEEKQPATPTATSAGRSGRFLVPVSALLSVIALAAGIGSAYLAYTHRQHRATEDHRTALIDAASREVLNVLTVHHTSVDRDVQLILDGATGQWRQEFEPQARPFTEAVQKAEVDTTAEIAGAGVERLIEGGGAQLLITAHSKVSNAAGSHEEPRTFRVRVTMAPDNGRLKIAKMEYVLS